MKKFLVIVLGIHIVLETLVGLALVFSPTSLIADATVREQSGMIVQGFCGLSAVALALWLLPLRRNLAALSVGLGGLASFHTLLIMSLFFTAPKPEELVGYTHHLLLAISFWVLWVQKATLSDASH